MWNFLLSFETKWDIGDWNFQYLANICVPLSKTSIYITSTN